MHSKPEQGLAIISRVTGTPVADLTPETDLVADLGLDSARSLQLLVELEENLDIEIDDDTAAGLETVGDVLTYLAG